MFRNCTLKDNSNAASTQRRAEERTGENCFVECEMRISKRIHHQKQKNAQKRMDFSLKT